MFIDNVKSVFDMELGGGLKWKDLNKEQEYQWCVYNFKEANGDMLFKMFQDFESEFYRLIEKDLIYPAYDFVVKSSHIFNLLDARGLISQKERTGYILRIRKMAKKVATRWIEIYS